MLKLIRTLNKNHKYSFCFQHNTLETSSIKYEFLEKSLAIPINNPIFPRTPIKLNFENENQIKYIEEYVKHFQFATIIFPKI